MDVRRASTADAEAIRQIYNLEVLETAATFDLVPRSLSDQVGYIESRSGALFVLVAEINGSIAGYTNLSFYRDKPAYKTAVETSVYTHRDFRGRGVANLLYESMIERAAAGGFHSVFARISGAKGPSMALHEKHGFKLVGTEVEVGRKFNRWYDVAVMQLMLD